MILLAGLRLDQDIEIVITGRRPGEKLHEELFHGDGAALVDTQHPGLKLAAPRTANHELLARGLDDLDRRGRRRRHAGRPGSAPAPVWSPSTGPAGPPVGKADFQRHPEAGFLTAFRPAGSN